MRTLAPDQGGQIPAIALTAYAGDTKQQQVIAAASKNTSRNRLSRMCLQAIVGLVRLP